MFASNLALAVALAGSQPVCEAGVDCAPVEEAQQGARQDLPAVPAEVLEEPAETAALPEGQDEAAETPTQGNVIVVEGQLGAPQGDPAEAINAATYEVVQAVDVAVVEPIASAYDKSVPKPIRTGLRNVLRNLGEPINFLNSLLQFKPGRALKSLGRFTINTTLGIGGLLDPAAKDFHLEYEANGLANTLGYYGVGPGPYLYLPLIGPTTLRDLAGRIVDLSILPLAVGKPFNKPIYTIPVATLNTLETRIEIDNQIDAIRERCGDPYGASRDIYLIQRQLEIDSLRGKQSDNLSELVDRLEFNCDIKILTSGQAAPGTQKQFIERNTTFLGTNDATLDGQPAVPSVEPTVAQPVADDPGAEAGVLPAPPATQELPTIRFISEPVIQPLGSD